MPISVRDERVHNDRDRADLLLQQKPICLMRYSLHELDTHDVVATTSAANRDEALEWFSEKLRLMLTFEGDPAEADYLLDEWPEGAHTANPTIPIFVVNAMAAHPQASRSAGRGQIRA